jgi:two-component system, NtrC family, response regulator AlgB
MKAFWTATVLFVNPAPGAPAGWDAARSPFPRRRAAGRGPAAPALPYHGDPAPVRGAHRGGRSLPDLDVLIVDDEPNIRRTLEVHFRARGHRVRTAAGAAEALAASRQWPCDLALVDVRLGAASGLDLLPELRRLNPRARLVVITAYASLETAVEALRRGAADYLRKPFAPRDLDLVLERLAAVDLTERRLQAEEEKRAAAEPEPLLESANPRVQEALRIARQVAASDTRVLLRGPSGSGKNVVAELIHRQSDRRGRPFVVVPCPAVPAELLESELFGHVRGAFTGATRDSPGRIALAAGGTLLLDEIGDLPPALQPKLLRFLQDRRYERLGDPTTRQADVRILAASNRDLEAAVAQGRFREDLLYRLNVITLELPPLAGRPEDLPALAERFLDHFRRRRGRPELRLSPAALAALAAHPWPGNLRELRNAFERATMLAPGPLIEPADLGLGGAPAGAAAAAAIALGGPVPLAAVEREHLRRVLAAAGSYRRAAAILGIDESTLWRKRQRYGL